MYRRKKRSGSTGLLRTLFAVVLALSMTVVLAVPKDVMAASNTKGPNSIVLDSLLSDRQFVPQVLMTGIRPEKDWGGQGFNNNPHMNVGGGVDHFMYEDLIDQYTSDVALKALVSLYTLKSELETYPIETLMKACEQMSNYNAFLYALKTANDAANNALKEAYDDLGGKYPVQETIAAIKADPETWDGYSLTRLESMVEGSEEYNEYKNELKDSEDELDNKLYTLLNQKEEECYDKETLKQLRDTVRSVQGVENQSTSEALKSTKIYDVILNDIFVSDYTSALGISTSRDTTAKTEYEQWSTALGNYNQALDYVSGAVDLTQQDAMKIMIEDYLDVLKSSSENQMQNLSDAFTVMEDEESWFKSDLSPKYDEIIALYGDSGLYANEDVASKRYYEAQLECNKRYMTQSSTADFLSTVGKTVSLAQNTLANYWLVDTLLRENETIRGVLNRVAGQTSGAGDAGFTTAVAKYRKLLDYNDGDAQTEIILSVLNTAVSELNSTLEKTVSKGLKKEARKALVSLGRDSVSRAKIAMTASRIANVYSAVDMLDDYCANYQEIAEKIYEIKYLQQLAEYAAESYNKDVKAYREEGSATRAEKYASNAIDDLQFLKQIKMRQNKDAYDALSGMQDETLAGWIAKIVSDGGGALLEKQYNKQMNALTQMQVFPVANAPFEVKSGQTLTITHEDYMDGRTTYVGTIRADGEIVGQVAEMDLYAADGISVSGNLIIDCDIRVPQIIGYGGSVTVESGRNPVIGYVDGDIYAGSDLHIRGSVNGSIGNYNKDNRIKITVDGSVSSGYLGPENAEFIIRKDLEATTLSMSSSKVTIEGNAQVETVLTGTSSDLTVKGDLKLSTFHDDDTRAYIGLKKSTVEVFGDFEYYGLGGDYWYLVNEYRLAEDSQLILHGVSTFDTYDKEQFSIKFADDTGRGSGIIIAGDGTARIINKIYPDQEVPQSWGLPEIVTKYSLEIKTDSSSGLQNVRFDTNRIAGFEDLVGTVNFPADMQVLETSTVDYATINCPGTMVFHKDLVARSMTSNSQLHIKGDFNVTGYSNLRKSVTVDGKTNLTKSLTVYSSIDSPVTITGNMFLNDGSELTIYKEKVPDDSAYTEAEIAAWENDTFALTVNGDILSRVGATIDAESLRVNGDLTTEGFDDATGKNSYIEAEKLYVKGYFDCKGNIIPGLGQSGIVDLTLEDGADLTGLSTSGQFTIRKVTILDPNDSVHEIITNENVRIRYLNVPDCRVSLPKGLRFSNLDIDGTMTVVGQVPVFSGKTAYTGKIVFEDTVRNFTLYNDESSSSGVTPPNNFFNKIHAKKDLWIYGQFKMMEPEVETDTAAGDLKVDGDLRFGTGANGTFCSKKIDFGNANIIVGQSATLDFAADEVTARGLTVQYPDSKFFMRCPLTDGERRHLILNGGDYQVNDDDPLVDWLTLNSDETGLIAGGDGTFGKVEANVPDLIVNVDKFDTDEFVSDTENIQISGNFKDIYLGTIPEEVRNKIKSIRFDNVYGLDKMYTGYDDNRVAYYTWDISNIEETETGNKYTGALILSNDPAGVHKVTFGRANENESYRYTRLFKNGSFILPYNYEDELMNMLYTEKKCYNLIDVTKHQVNKDMDLYYRSYAFSEIPDDPEVILLDEEKEVTPGALYETKTFAFTPETDGMYGFESMGDLYPDGCIAVEDGKYYSERYRYDTQHFSEKFLGRAGATYYLQSRLDYGDVGTYKVKVSRLGDIEPDEPDEPDHPDDPDPDEPDPHLNTIPVEEIQSVELIHDRPYTLSIANSDNGIGFSTGIDYVMRRGDKFIIHKKNGTSVTYTYGDYYIGEYTTTTVLNDGTDWLRLWEEEVHETDENGNLIPWQAGENHKWKVTYSMTPWAAEDKYPDCADNITCLVDVYVAGEEEYDLGIAKEDAIRDIDIELIGEYEGYLDDYAPEQKEEILRIAAESKQAVENAETAEEARRISEEAIAAKNKIYKSYQIEEMEENWNSAKENFSGFKDENMLDECYTQENKRLILDRIAETERAIDEVMAARDNYATYYEFYDYYYDTIWNLSYDCVDYIDSLEEKEYVSSLVVKLTPDRYRYDGRVKRPKVTVIADGIELPESEYRIDWPADCKNVGDYFVDVYLTGQYRGSNAEVFSIEKAANTVTAKGKTATVKYSKLKKKNQTIAAAKAFTVSKAQGKVTYKVAAYDKKAKKKITINSAGKITVKKGLKKGKYKMKVKVIAGGNRNYYAATRTVTITIKVK
ncbi:MAG: hypothetical protein IJH43_07505 [Mogibacterium sp.]|nr:hypothetical protein [Mogibacterium sp.]